MRRHERHPQSVGAGAAHEHHDDTRRAGALGEEFRVSEEGNAGILDRALLHRAGDERGERAVAARVAPGLEQREHGKRVGGIGMPGYGRRGERVMPDRDRTAERRERERIVARVTHVRADARGACGQEPGVAEHDEPRGKRLSVVPLRKPRDELRTDAGRLARGDRDRRERRHRLRQSGSTFTAAGSPNTCASTFSIARAMKPPVRSASILT
jgi:hypothetical protein